MVMKIPVRLSTRMENQYPCTATKEIAPSDDATVKSTDNPLIRLHVPLSIVVSTLNSFINPFTPNAQKALKMKLIPHRPSARSDPIGPSMFSRVVNPVSTAQLIK